MNSLDWLKIALLSPFSVAYNGSSAGALVSCVGNRVMTVQGHVENGRIVLDQEAVLPEGTKVEVRLLTTESTSADEAGLPTLYERFKSVIGQAKGLPSDFAANHDHYIHG